jgi:hypothetical protein
MWGESDVGGITGEGGWRRKEKKKKGEKKVESHRIGKLIRGRDRGGGGGIGGKGGGIPPLQYIISKM